MSIRLFLTVAGLGVLLAGCGNRSETPATPNAAVTTEAAPGPAAAEVTAATTASEADLGAVLAELTQVLRKYGFERKDLPKTVEVLVAAGYLPAMPQAPAGKKFAIDAKSVKIVLVNN